jgi:hypothetical protein
MVSQWAVESVGSKVVQRVETRVGSTAAETVGSLVALLAAQ